MPPLGALCRCGSVNGNVAAAAGNLQVATADCINCIASGGRDWFRCSRDPGIASRSPGRFERPSVLHRLWALLQETVCMTFFWDVVCAVYTN